MSIDRVDRKGPGKGGSRRRHLGAVKYDPCIRGARTGTPLLTGKTCSDPPNFSFRSDRCHSDHVENGPLHDRDHLGGEILECRGGRNQ